MHAEGRELVLCGDINIARTDIDVHPRERKPGIIGQRPEERELFEALLGDRLVDVGRALDPDNAGLFTWWPPWRNMRQRNIGWRIDYVLASKAIAERAQSCKVLADFGTSDHAPVMMDILVSGGVNLRGWRIFAGGRIVLAGRIFFDRAEFLVAGVDGHGVVVVGIFCTVARAGLPQPPRVEVAHEDGRAHAAHVDPAQDRLGTPSHEHQLGNTAKFEPADPVTVNHPQAEPDFPAIVHAGTTRCRLHAVSLIHDQAPAEGCVLVR